MRVVLGDPGMGKGEGEEDGEVEEQLEQEMLPIATISHHYGAPSRS